MKFRLRHVVTKKWLTHSGEWTEDRNAALQFDTAAEANNFRIDCGVPRVEVDPAPDRSLPGGHFRPRW